MTRAARRPPPNGDSTGPLRSARIETVLVFVRDLPMMIRFYRDTLGLSVEYSNEHFAQLTAGGGASISLHFGRDSPPQTDGDLMVEFLVDDIEGAVAELARRGVSVDPIRSEPFGKIANFRDPEGHRIGLEQPNS